MDSGIKCGLQASLGHSQIANTGEDCAIGLKLCKVQLLPGAVVKIKHDGVKLGHFGQGIHPVVNGFDLSAATKGDPFEYAIDPRQAATRSDEKSRFIVTGSDTEIV